MTTVDIKREQFLNRVNDMSSKHLYMSAAKLSNTLTIGGAPNKFRRNPDTIYVPKYRLVGTADEVQKVLTLYNLDADLGEYYTVDNYSTSQSYSDEVTARKSYQDSLRKNDQDAVDDLIKNIDRCRIRLPSIFDRRATKKNVVRSTNSNKKKRVQFQDEVQHDEQEEEQSVEDRVSQDLGQQDEGHQEEEEQSDNEVEREDDNEVEREDDEEVEQEEDEEDTVPIEDVESVQEVEEEEQSEDNSYIIKDVRMNRPKSPKRHPVTNTNKREKEETRTKLSTRLPPINTDSTDIQDSSSKSTRTRLAPIVQKSEVPKVLSRSEEESSTRRRLKPIIN